MSLRDQMARVQKLAADKFGIGARDWEEMVLVCHLRGRDERREPGIYRVDTGLGHIHPEIVLDPEEEDAQRERFVEQLRIELKAPVNWNPMTVTCHFDEAPTAPEEGVAP